MPFWSDLLNGNANSDFLAYFCGKWIMLAGLFCIRSKAALRILIFFNCHGCRLFIWVEFHWDLSPHIFWTYEFILRQCATVFFKLFWNSVRKKDSSELKKKWYCETNWWKHVMNSILKNSIYLEFVWPSRPFQLIAFHKGPTKPWWPYIYRRPVRHQERPEQLLVRKLAECWGSCFLQQ